MKPFVYQSPQNIEEAVSFLKLDGYSVLAGGSDILGEIKDDVVEVQGLVDLGKLEGLSDVDEAESEIRIGSMVNVSDLANNGILVRRCPVLPLAARSVATEQIRNIGTIGGNLCQRPRCWYYRNKRFNCLKKGGDVCFAVNGLNKYHSIIGGHRCHIVHPSDIAVALMSLNASVNLFDKDGLRTLPIEDFFISPEVDVTRENILGKGDILTRIDIPKEALDCSGIYLKAKERESMDFALVSVAISIKILDGVIERCGVSVGGVSPVPLRIKELEERLHGLRVKGFCSSNLTMDLFRSAKPMSDNEYKLPLLESYLKKALDWVLSISSN